MTRIDDLSIPDVERVKRRALIELTALLENSGIQMKVRKAPKRKYRGESTQLCRPSDDV